MAAREDAVETNGQGNQTRTAQRNSGVAGDPQQTAQQTQAPVPPAGIATRALNDMSNLVTSLISEATDRAEASVQEVEQHLSQTATDLMSKTLKVIQERPLAVLGGMVLLGVALDRLVLQRKASPKRPLNKDARGK